MKNLSVIIASLDDTSPDRRGIGSPVRFPSNFNQSQQNDTSLPRAPLVGKTPPAGGGGTQVPKGERLSSECETERLYEEQLHLELTAIETLFVRVRVSLCFSFSSVGLALSGADAPAVPLFGFAIFPRPGEIFPKGGALGKEGKLFLYPLYSFALAIC